MLIRLGHTALDVVVEQVAELSLRDADSVIVSASVCTKQNFDYLVSTLDAHASGVPAERKNYSAGLHDRIEGVADAPVQRTILRSSHPDFAPNALVDFADLTRAVWRVEQAKIRFNAISGHLFAEILRIHMELRGGVRRKVIGERGPRLVARERVNAHL